MCRELEGSRGYHVRVYGAVCLRRLLLLPFFSFARKRRSRTKPANSNSSSHDGLSLISIRLWIVKFNSSRPALRNNKAYRLCVRWRRVMLFGQLILSCDDEQVAVPVSRSVSRLRMQWTPIRTDTRSQHLHMFYIELNSIRMLPAFFSLTGRCLRNF